MKQVRAFFLTLTFAVVYAAQFFLQPVFAAPTAADPYGLNESAKRTPYAPSIAQGKTLPQIIGSVISVALSLVGIIFLCLALYAGFKWMTAQGNEDEVKEATDTLLHAAGGVIVIVAAYALTNFIMTQVISPISGN